MNAKFGHHPDPLIDAEVEVGRLKGLLTQKRRELEQVVRAS